VTSVAGSRLRLRTAAPSQARRLHSAIAGHVAEGHLLPRSREEVAQHVERFVVAMRGRRLAGFAELAPLGGGVGEIRSLVVLDGERSTGVGKTLVTELSRRARRDGFEKLCAFTHVPGYFAAMGFSIVPHLWLPEKVFTDCVGCTLFRRCRQTAMELTLDDTHDRTPEADAPAAAPHV
jgi:amino-acid N-acetyltransferase